MPPTGKSSAMAATGSGRSLQPRVGAAGSSPRGAAASERTMTVRSRVPPSDVVVSRSLCSVAGAPCATQRRVREMAAALDSTSRSVTPGALCRNRLIEGAGPALRIPRTALPPTGKSSAMAATGSGRSLQPRVGARGVVDRGQPPPSNPSVGCALASVGSSSLSESQYRRASSQEHPSTPPTSKPIVGAGAPTPGLGLRAVRGTRPAQRAMTACSRCCLLS